MKTGECRALGEQTLGRGCFQFRTSGMIKELATNSSDMKVTKKKEEEKMQLETSGSYVKNYTVKEINFNTRCCFTLKSAALTTHSS